MSRWEPPIPRASATNARGVGETWLVQLPGQVEVTQIRIEGLTECTVIVTVIPLPGAIQQRCGLIRYVRQDVTFIERLHDRVVGVPR